MKESVERVERTGFFSEVYYDNFKSHYARNRVPVFIPGEMFHTHFLVHTVTPHIRK